MSTDEAVTPPAAPGADAPGSTDAGPGGQGELATSTYQLLRDRLRGVAEELRQASERLNERRAEVFAPVPLRLAEQERLRTEQPSIPHDIVSVGDLLLFGFDAGGSLGRTRSVADAFALFRVARASDTDWTFTPVGPEDPAWFLHDPTFTRDVGELFTYYAEARLTGLQLRNDRLLMVFAVGAGTSDVRVLRWQIDGDVPRYIDAYGDNDLVEIEPFDFEWTEAGRDQINEGRWRHYEIGGALYIGLAATRRPTGSNTVEFRVDDAVAGGRTVHTDGLVEDQQLDELGVAYAILGDVTLVRLTPYREADARYFVFNRLTREVTRADAIGRNCRQLPEGQGVVFPGGYHLQNGETKVFATDASGYELHDLVRSPNGEDILYAYHRPDTGEYLLCAYNVVARTMSPPLATYGYAVFDDGTIVTIRATPDPQRVHAISVYTSPFCDVEHYAPNVPGDSFFGRIGNAELVGVLGETLSLARDAMAPDFNAAVFEAFVARATTLVDTHPWVDAPEANGIGRLLADLRRTAGDVLDEFAAVVAAKRDAAALLETAVRVVDDLSAEAELELRDTGTYIERLADARGVLGRLAELTEVREMDLDAVAAARERAQEVHDRLAERAIEFLGSDDALAGLGAELDAAEAAGREATTAVQVAEQTAAVDELGVRVVLLTEVVGGLAVEDTTVKTAVLTRLSDVLARRNGVRATLDARATQLRTAESASAFQAAMAVLSQRAQASLTAAGDADACDAALTALLAELETIELSYGDVETFAVAVATKRDELVTAFTQRRDALAGERSRHIDRLVASARRVLETVVGRASAQADKAGVEAFFAADPLVGKVRAQMDELRALGEAGRASELEVALNRARDQARRAVVDHAELFDEGTVKIGRWRFGVNTESFELRLDSDADGSFRTRLTGTELTLPLDDPELAEFTDLASQVYPSEPPGLPRALFLAFEAHAAGVGADGVAEFAARRIEDGYEPGVHDADAATILHALAPWWGHPALTVHGVERAVAGVWLRDRRPTARDELLRRFRAVAELSAHDPSASDATTGSNGEGHALGALVAELGPDLTAFAEACGLGDGFDASAAVEGLVRHAAAPEISSTGAALADEFAAWAEERSIDAAAAPFADVVRWIRDRSPQASPAVAAEAAWILHEPTVAVAGVAAEATVSGLLSSHPAISGGTLTFDVGRMHTAHRRYRRTGLARFRRFAEVRQRVLAAERARLEIDQLRPKVLTSFVRNRLVDEVYLPLIGDNFARQLGLNGAAQGLLMLISPPGYGKTTLVEYLADLLGFAMVKINGPALGEAVTSLDPRAAPDAASAEELTKLNRAFAMGNNVICVLDDIQHTSPELLQKFIPLCDATRRIEGVLDGRAQTFSLSGRRFVMVMAGNPYTSAGATFRIPDMLANRADVHNLGDVASGARAAFAQSYIENSCGVNEVVAPLLTADRGDLDSLLRAADGEPVRSDALSRSYPAGELSAVTKTLGHLARVRDVLLRVNAAYIASASVDDHLRGEPPFLLQGSYRNMARIAQRVVPAMTAEEVDALVLDHYRAESQTLAAASTWNLAKFAEVTGRAGPDELAALDDLRSRWREANVAGDPLAAIAATLRNIEQKLRPGS